MTSSRLRAKVYDVVREKSIYPLINRKRQQTMEVESVKKEDEGIPETSEQEKLPTINIHPFVKEEEKENSVGSKTPERSEGIIKCEEVKSEVTNMMDADASGAEMELVMGTGLQPAQTVPSTSSSGSLTALQHSKILESIVTEIASQNLCKTEKNKPFSTETTQLPSVSSDGQATTQPTPTGPRKRGRPKGSITKNRKVKGHQLPVRNIISDADLYNLSRQHQMSIPQAATLIPIEQQQLAALLQQQLLSSGDLPHIYNVNQEALQQQESMIAQLAALQQLSNFQNQLVQQPEQSSSSSVKDTSDLEKILKVQLMLENRYLPPNIATSTEHNSRHNQILKSSSFKEQSDLDKILKAQLLLENRNLTGNTGNVKDKQDLQKLVNELSSIQQTSHTPICLTSPVLQHQTITSSVPLLTTPASQPLGAVTPSVPPFTSSAFSAPSIITSSQHFTPSSTPGSSSSAFSAPSTVNSFSSSKESSTKPKVTSVLIDKASQPDVNTQLMTNLLLETQEVIKALNIMDAVNMSKGATGGACAFPSPNKIEPKTSQPQWQCEQTDLEKLISSLNPHWLTSDKVSPQPSTVKVESTTATEPSIAIPTTTLDQKMSDLEALISSLKSSSPTKIDAASTMSQQRNLNNSFISLGLDQLLPKSRGRPYGSTTNKSKGPSSENGRRNRGRPRKYPDQCYQVVNGKVKYPGAKERRMFYPGEISKPNICSGSDQDGAPGSPASDSKPDSTSSIQGSPSSTTGEQRSNVTTTTTKSKRGRPKGSKNRPLLVTSPYQLLQLRPNSSQNTSANNFWSNIPDLNQNPISAVLAGLNQKIIRQTPFSV